jgi:Holliday junction resolvasome RuvABC DNA-binding subunit
MTVDSIITLSIDEAAPPGQGVFIFDVIVEGELVSSNPVRNPIASQIRPAVDALISELGYTQEQFEAMLKEVAESSQRDRGRSLIDAAFGED